MRRLLLAAAGLAATTTPVGANRWRPPQPDRRPVMAQVLDDTVTTEAATVPAVATLAFLIRHTNNS
jgi:hypothetical protein